MADSAASIRTAIDAARRVIAEIARANQNFPHPVNVNPASQDGGPLINPSLGDGILATVSALHGLPITVSHPRSGMTDLYGALLRYTDHAEIWVSPRLNRCWRRFMVCKESAHILLGAQENYTQNAPDAIGLIATQLNSLTLDDPQNMVEQTAFFTAMEMLMPRELLGAVREMHEQGCTNNDIAHSIYVPEKIIDVRLSPQFDDIFNSAYANLDSKAA